MKKAVIATGGKQYLVTEGETLEVELLNNSARTVDFIPLLVIDDKNILVGAPQVNVVKVSASIEEPDLKTDKVIAIRYKSKKRVHKIRGHRQRITKIRISSIK